MAAFGVSSPPVALQVPRILSDSVSFRHTPRDFGSQNVLPVLMFPAASSTVPTAGQIWPRGNPTI